MPVLKSFIFAVVLGLVGTARVDAATTNLVKIGESGIHFFFNPTNLTINAGDTIKWTNTVVNPHDSTHNPPSGPLLWRSPDFGSTSSTNTYSFTFTNAGFYPYFCLLHAPISHPEQTGTVTVVTAPTITLGSVQRLPDGTFQFRVSGGSAGQKCIIDTCDTLPNWIPIFTNTFPNTVCPACPFIDFTNTVNNPTRHFYRSRVFP